MKNQQQPTSSDRRHGRADSVQITRRDSKIIVAGINMLTFPFLGKVVAEDSQSDAK